jgi:hypothetical protein
MNQMKSPGGRGNCILTIVKYALAAIIIFSASNCSKSTSPSSSSTGPGGTNSNPLLSKEVIVSKNTSGEVVDSLVIQYQYDANKNLTQVQQSTNIQISGVIGMSMLTYNFTYSGSLLSSMTGTVNQSLQSGAQNYNSTTQVNASFISSGGHITSYVQTASSTGSGPFPVTPETGNDSALIQYDASGNITGFTLYQIGNGGVGYQLISQQNFTYSNGNMTQLVDVESVAGVPVNTVTSVYQFNSDISASPYYVGPGIPIVNVNDITSINQTTTGTNPQTLTTAYSSTYNTANQPVSSSVTLTPTPTDPNAIATEEITYTY